MPLLYFRVLPVSPLIALCVAGTRDIILAPLPSPFYLPKTMSVRRAIAEKDGIYFITFTCKNWLPLLELTNSYDAVYKWFDYLKANGHYITGYVILPNHLHVLIGFKALTQSINTVVSNGKRFIAYEIIKRLQEQNNTVILKTLSDAVTDSDRKRGKLHRVFESSFFRSYRVCHFFNK